MPTSYVELDSEEMSYVDGGAFLGVQMTYGQILDFLDGLQIMYDVLDCGSQLSAACPIIAMCTAKLSSYVGAVLSAIPVWGWIAAGVLAAATATLFTYCLINKCGFKIGVDVGFFKVKRYWRFR